MALKAAGPAGKGIRGREGGGCRGKGGTESDHICSNPILVVGFAEEGCTVGFAKEIIPLIDFYNGYLRVLLFMGEVRQMQRAYAGQRRINGKGESIQKATTCERKR